MALYSYGLHSYGRTVEQQPVEICRPRALPRAGRAYRVMALYSYGPMSLWPYIVMALYSYGPI